MNFNNVQQLYFDRLCNAINTNEIFNITIEENGFLYIKCRDKLLSDIMKLEELVFKNKDCTLELVLCVDDCLRSFKPDKGLFTHYFLRSFKSRFPKISPECEKPKATGKDVIEVKEMLSRIRGKYPSEANIEDVKIIADVLGLETSCVEKIILAERAKGCISDHGENDDGKEYSYIELNSAQEKSAEDAYIEDENVIRLLDDAQKLYDGLILSQKQVVSLCFTADVSEELLSSGLDISKYSIINKEILLECKARGKKMSDKELAARLGKKHASTSRTYGQFKGELEKIRK